MLRLLLTTYWREVCIYPSVCVSMCVCLCVCDVCVCMPMCAWVHTIWKVPNERKGHKWDLCDPVSFVIHVSCYVTSLNAPFNHPPNLSSIYI